MWRENGMMTRLFFLEPKIVNIVFIKLWETIGEE